MQGPGPRCPPVVLALLLTTVGALPAQAPEVPFEPGMVVTRSVTIRPGSYLAPADSTAAIIIRGDGITLGLDGVELIGSEDRHAPDRFAGTAIFIDGGRQIAVQGARIRGYKVGILARGTHGLSLTGNDLSHNWRPRLYSGIERESLVDWLSFHQNENDEWLRHGAAI